jgi:protease I
MHVLMVIAPREVRDEELLQPEAAFEAEWAVVEVASTTTEIARGMLGAQVEADLAFCALDPHRCAAIALVGGSDAASYLWDNHALHALLRIAYPDGTPLGAICLAPATLARAGLLPGLRATVWGDAWAKHDLERAGALYVTAHVVSDGGIVTAAGDARAFAEALIGLVRSGPKSVRGACRRARAVRSVRRHARHRACGATGGHATAGGLERRRHLARRNAASAPSGALSVGRPGQVALPQRVPRPGGRSGGVPRRGRRSTRGPAGARPLARQGRFHVRAERRGHRGVIDSHACERALGAFLWEGLEARGGRPQVHFHDPDVVLAVEVVGDTAGLGLVTRELRARFPFVRID